MSKLEVYDMSLALLKKIIKSVRREELTNEKLYVLLNIIEDWGLQLLTVDPDLGQMWDTMITNIRGILDR